MRQPVPDLRQFKRLLRLTERASILTFRMKTSMRRSVGDVARFVLMDIAGEVQVPGCERSIGMVDEIRRSWGYDGSGRWHRGIAEVAPLRREAGTGEDDALAPARGTVWGLLFSAVFWLPIGVAVFLSWRR